nr:hypothetical protein [Yersinia proxima]
MNVDGDFKDTDFGIAPEAAHVMLTSRLTLHFSPENLRLNVGTPTSQGKPAKILQSVDNKSSWISFIKP